MEQALQWSVGILVMTDKDHAAILVKMCCCLSLEGHQTRLDYYVNGLCMWKQHFKEGLIVYSKEAEGRKSHGFC